LYKRVCFVSRGWSKICTKQGNRICDKTATKKVEAKMRRLKKPTMTTHGRDDLYSFAALSDMVK